MEFRSVHQLNCDIATWSQSLPDDIELPDDIDLVVGIPRSGMLAATMLALHMHKPLGDLDGLIAGRVLGGGERLESDGSPVDAVATARRILAVDDSTNRGGAVREAKQKVAAGAPHLTDRVVRGAPYVTPGAAEGLVDHWYEKVPQPRAFEWNILHHSGLKEACMSLDGVLCREPTPQEVTDDAAYRAYLRDVPPRLVPGALVGWLVTSRHERYRAETEAWLEAHGVRYGELVMAPDAPTHQDPQGRGPDVKADAYARTRAWLFVEADVEQARHIADACGRPVYCTSVRTMVYPGVPVGAPARLHHTMRWRADEMVRMQKKRLAAARRRVQRLLPVRAG